MQVPKHDTVLSHAYCKVRTIAFNFPANHVRDVQRRWVGHAAMARPGGFGIGPRRSARRSQQDGGLCFCAALAGPRLGAARLPGLLVHTAATGEAPPLLESPVIRRYIDGSAVPVQMPHETI